MQQFTELERMRDLSLYSQSQRRELRDKIMTSKYQCLQWAFHAGIDLIKVVRVREIVNRDELTSRDQSVVSPL